MTYRNADTEISPSSIERVASVYFPSHWTPEEARAWIDTVVPPKHKSADTRIREAFAALRAEIEGVFGASVPDMDLTSVGWPASVIDWLDALELELHRFAKQPASEG